MCTSSLPFMAHETPLEIGDHIRTGTPCKTSECKLGLSIQPIHSGDGSRTQDKLLSFSFTNACWWTRLLLRGREKKRRKREGSLEHPLLPPGSLRYDCGRLKWFRFKTLALISKKPRTKTQKTPYRTHNINKTYPL